MGVRREDVYSWGQTIICQFNHKKLRAALEECAKEIGCHIWNGEPGSPDIIAIPAFIIIVDRRTVGKDVWRQYVDFCKEVADVVPCLIIDNQTDWSLPEMKFVRQFDISDPASILSMINIVKEFRKRNLPVELQGKKIPVKQKTEMKYDESKGLVKSTYFKYE